MMHNTGYQKRNYLLAAGLGAFGGGVLVLILTKAIPRLMSTMMSEMMSGMMQNMAECMGEEETSPAEI